MQEHDSSVNSMLSNNKNGSIIQDGDKCMSCCNQEETVCYSPDILHTLNLKSL